MQITSLLSASLPLLAALTMAPFALGASGEGTAEPQPEGNTGGPVEVAYGEGLVVSWPGGEVGLEGLFEVGSKSSASEGARDPESEFYLKRFRPELFGSFEGGWRFRFEPKFDDSGVELEEAWVGRELGDGLLRLGRMKAPFGLEEVRSRRHVHFPRFSVLNQFSPAEDHGIFYEGEAGRLEYGLALVNGTSGAEADSGKDVVLRGMWHLGEQDEAHFSLGLAGTLGDEDFGIGGDVITNAGGAAALEFAPGVALGGTRSRLGLELAYFDGPWMAQAEFLSLREELVAGGSTQTAAIQGGYLDVARSLTGEDLTFGGVSDPNESWVAALRLSSLDFSEELSDPAFVSAGRAPGRIDSLSVGLSYIPGPHTIVRAAWAHSFYEDPIVIGSKSLDDEGTLTVELQLHF